MVGHLLGLAVTGALAFASPGHAAPSYNQPAAEQAMLAAASSYWQQAPTCSEPELVRVDNPAVTSTVARDAWAYVLPDGPQTCEIFLVQRYWSSEYENSDQMFGQACRIVAHEYAHLLNLWDVAEPGTMLDQHIGPKIPDPYCDEAAAKFVTGTA